MVNCLLSDELGTEIDFLLFELLDELELELDDSGFLTTGFVFLPSFRNALKPNLLFFLFFTEDTFDEKEEEDVEDDVTEDVFGSDVGFINGSLVRKTSSATMIYIYIYIYLYYQLIYRKIYSDGMQYNVYNVDTMYGIIVKIHKVHKVQGVINRREQGTERCIN